MVFNEPMVSARGKSLDFSLCKSQKNELYRNIINLKIYNGMIFKPGSSQVERIQ